jgi:cytidine deaminase
MAPARAAVFEVNMDRETALVEAAKSTRQRAYARYSRFPVGAALRAANGEIFVGCNVENVSYGLTICAERAAVFAAVAAGQRRFSALAVVADGGVTPCGACRQVLAEFGDDLPIYLVDSAQGDRIEEVRLRELLPRAFRFEA